ncbi:MAG: hypothetical protein WBX25_10200 [Rhodomicrobium sp.]
MWRLRRIPLFQAVLLASLGEEPIPDLDEKAESVALRDSLFEQEASSAPSIPNQGASLLIFPVPGKFGFLSME